MFMSVHLDESGQGSVSVRLPHNVTSWRLTGAAISESLKAGSETQEVAVSLPLFINTNLNKTYLSGGDEPYIGVAAYGSELSGEELITYTVKSKGLGYEFTTIGKAYEKINLPLPSLAKGTYEIEVIAIAENGMSDGHVSVVEVFDSYQQMMVSDAYVAKEGLSFTTSDEGMTSITFADQSKGMYVDDLYRLAYSGGKRVDQSYVTYLAKNILIEEFGANISNDLVALADYISEDGGIGILPYSEVSIETTVQLLPFMDNVAQRQGVIGYLYSKLYETSNKEKSKALVGLALAGENILLELNHYNMTENIGYEEHVDFAYAYSILGDDYMANYIFDQEIRPLLDVNETVARVKKKVEVKKTTLDTHHRYCLWFQDLKRRKVTYCSSM